MRQDDVSTQRTQTVRGGYAGFGVSIVAQTETIGEETTSNRLGVNYAPSEVHNVITETPRFEWNTVLNNRPVEDLEQAAIIGRTGLNFALNLLESQVRPQDKSLQKRVALGHEALVGFMMSGHALPTAGSIDGRPLHDAIRRDQELGSLHVTRFNEQVQAASLPVYEVLESTLWVPGENDSTIGVMYRRVVEPSASGPTVQEERIISLERTEETEDENGPALVWAGHQLVLAAGEAPKLVDTSSRVPTATDLRQLALDRVETPESDLNRQMSGDASQSDIQEFVDQLIDANVISDE
jgi:hypothetical protein